jgi:hydroxymethylpyrimidine pyrophosphatase-like HAD family hydrolase
MLTPSTSIMKLFVFLDLDDTIFQTQRKCPLDQAIVPAAFAQDGSALSFFTQKQAELFNLINRKTYLIPTTARSYEAFKRTQIAQQFEYAIINHGGIILNKDGSIHQAWLSHIETLLTATADSLSNLKQFLQTKINTDYPSLTIRLINDLGLNFYILIKHSSQQPLLLNSLVSEVIKPYLLEQSLNFYCHLNDNNLAILPNYLNKVHAVRFLKAELDQQHHDYISLGIGDSLTDIPYMQLCDYLITPQNSQIAQNCFKPYSYNFQDFND